MSDPENIVHRGLKYCVRYVVKPDRVVFYITDDMGSSWYSGTPLMLNGAYSTQPYVVGRRNPVNTGRFRKRMQYSISEAMFKAIEWCDEHNVKYEKLKEQKAENEERVMELTEIVKIASTL